MRLAKVAYHSGQMAPLLLPWQAGYALGGLFLHHYGNARKARPAQKQAGDHIRGDIIGQIGHHARAGGGQCAQVSLECVGKDHARIFAALQQAGKHRLQPLVYLHGGDGMGTPRKQIGHHARAGANLQHVILHRDAG